VADRNLDDLEAKARAATQPSPWTTQETSNGETTVVDTHGMWVAEVGFAPDDAAHIAAASPSVILALIARLRAAEAVVQAAEAVRAANERAGCYGYGDSRPEALAVFIAENDACAALDTALSAYRATKEQGWGAGMGRLTDEELATMGRRAMVPCGGCSLPLDCGDDLPDAEASNRVCKRFLDCAECGAITQIAQREGWDQWYRLAFRKEAGGDWNKTGLEFDRATYYRRLEETS
jgi:hypothetical protein